MKVIIKQGTARWEADAESVEAAVLAHCQALYRADRIAATRDGKPWTRSLDSYADGLVAYAHPETLSGYLPQLIAAAGVTKAEFARRCGVSKQYINNLTSGTTDLSYPRFLEMCRCVGVEPEVVLLVDAQPV